MSFQGIGDLATSYQLRRDNARLQETLQTLANELATGRKADLGQAVAGDFGAISGIERALTSIGAYQTAAAETRLMADAAQASLELVRSKASETAGQLLIASGEFQPGLVNAAVETAARAFEDSISALNIRVADRSVFAGIATDGPALASPDTMLTELETLIAGETTAVGVQTVVASWFGAGGGFETMGFVGNETPLSAIPISQDEKATLDVTAADDGVRDVLAGLATAALLARGALAAEIDERATLAQTTGQQLIEADYAITDTRARVGITQERIEDAATRNTAEAQALDLARSTLIAADPFETASQLAAVEVQLETLYAVTARLSRLSLAGYL